MAQAGLKEWVRRFGAVAAATILITVLAIAGIYRWKKGGNAVSPPSRIESVDTPLTEGINPHQLALQRIEEDRGEPTGNKAKIEIPAELKLYKDAKRFLAIQVAEWREQQYKIPHDFADLATMVRQGEFTILPALTPHYMLYGVGLKADSELTHYDQKTKRPIPLFAGEAELSKEMERLNKALADSETKIRELRSELERLSRGERTLRREKTDEIASIQKAMAADKTRKKLLDDFYKSKDGWNIATREYGRLSELAGDFNGQSYDLNDPDSRQKLKVQLLSSLRPPALRQLEEIAKAYQEKFNRPLPVTSLVRTIEYQRHLGESGNPNAVSIDVPPHTTGLAFDIYTYYMAAAEQQFLLDEIARLEKEGRVEALRENRFHIHVFAFADMKPPAETLIKKSFSMRASADDNDRE
jgi:hypothetical protein